MCWLEKAGIYTIEGRAALQVGRGSERAQCECATHAKARDADSRRALLLEVGRSRRDLLHRRWEVEVGHE
eukprot:scaffold10265_cov58-Phaeocystis_antarctica.AAC.6